MRKDLAEIGDSLKSGLSKFTFNFLRFNDDDHNNCNQEGGYEDDVAGINEEVIGFVKEISLRPECWVDFPLPLQNGKKETHNLLSFFKTKLSAVNNYSFY